VTRSDAELLRAHLAGDRGAFTVLATRYERLLWQIAKNKLGDREDAADAVQDTLLRAHQAAARCQSTDSIRAWLVRILLNICLDRFRRDKARPADPIPADVLEQVPAPRNPISDHETRLDVYDALAQLPPEQGEILLLVDIAGWSVSEVAEQLGIAEGTVKSRGWRGRRRMTELCRIDLPSLQSATEER
jgi:RNA polymerase sigma-70 factor, ECF subfamily